MKILLIEDDRKTAEFLGKANACQQGFCLLFQFLRCAFFQKGRGEHNVFQRRVLRE